MLRAAGRAHRRRRQHRRPARRRASTMRRSTRSSSSARSFRLAWTRRSAPRPRRGSTSPPTTSTGTRSMATYEAAKARIFANQRPTDVGDRLRRRPGRDAPPRRARRPATCTFGRAGADYRVDARRRRARRARRPASPRSRRCGARLPARHHQRAGRGGARARDRAGRRRTPSPRRSATFAGPPHRIELVGEARRRALVQRLQGDDAARRVGGDPRLRPHRADRRRLQQGRRPVADGRRARADRAPWSRSARPADDDRRPCSPALTPVRRRPASMAEAVDARRASWPGPATPSLLSPGCASFDWYPTAAIRRAATTSAGSSPHIAAARPAIDTTSRDDADDRARPTRPSATVDARRAPHGGRRRRRAPPAARRRDRRRGSVAERRAGARRRAGRRAPSVGRARVLATSERSGPAAGRLLRDRRRRRRVRDARPRDGAVGVVGHRGRPAAARRTRSSTAS